mmetsp:Transcript_22594/g.40243  ORF Transcript_22594/g.40243 Transcript_22594/m.40243 type:complete len:201 (-) Transcript_22594:482-1084(-)
MHLLAETEIKSAAAAENVVQWVRRRFIRCDVLLALAHSLHLVLVLTLRLLLLERAYRVWRHIRRVFIQCHPLKAPRKDLDWVQAEARPHFHQRHLPRVLGLILRQHSLVIPDPHVSVAHRKRYHVIKEWLRFVVSLWGGKHLCEHLLQELKVWLLVERGVEAQHWSRPLEVITRQLQFVHRVNVLHVELDRRPSARLCHP